MWAKNYSRTKWDYTVKITSWMIYNHINLNQKELYKRKMIQNGSDINAQEKLSQSRKCLCHSISVFTIPPSNLASSNGDTPVIWIISLYLWYQVHFVIIIVEYLVTVLSITYLKIIFWGWTIPLNYNQICHVSGNYNSVYEV